MHGSWWWSKPALKISVCVNNIGINFWVVSVSYKLKTNVLVISVRENFYLLTNVYSCPVYSKEEDDVLSLDGNGNGLFMHFSDSNHEVTRMQQRKNSSITQQKLISCWWKQKKTTAETQSLANWWLCSNMFESQRVGRKTIWVNCWASPVASANNIFNEDVSDVVKESNAMHRINVK